ncbi:hypothetical protein ACHAPN_001027 [Verticillium nonalfalfae]
MTDAHSQKRRKIKHGAAAAAVEPAAAISKPAPTKEQSPEPAPPTSTTDEAAANQDDAPVAKKSFADLGVVESLVEATEALGYKHPTPIQEKSIPLALAGRDVIGLAETGSGKTAAFALPVLQALLEKPSGLFAVVMAPTRELAAQIAQTFEALGSLINLRCAVIVGGLDMVQQAIALGKKPHVVVATPLLDMDFGPSIDKILKFIPRERHTYLFSATMSSKVESLQRASLKDPARVSVQSNGYQVVSTLLQNFLFIPHALKDVYCVHLINSFIGQTTIVFLRTVHDTQRLAILLRTLGFSALPLHGQLSQSARLGALNKFRAGSRDILVATDVAARGLDIPNVDVVINYDLPQDSKTYIHRVGRTARAGKSGRALSLVTQYDLEIWLRIEASMGKKLDEFPTEKEEVMVFQARVEEAQRHARIEMKHLMENRGKKGAVLKGKFVGDSKRRHDGMDADEG